MVHFTVSPMGGPTELTQDYSITKICALSSGTVVGTQRDRGVNGTEAACSTFLFNVCVNATVSIL